MRNPAAFILVALLLGACSDGGPVGYYDPNKVFAESRFARETMQEAGAGEVDKARADADRLANEAAHADEITAATKKEKADAARTAVDAMERKRTIAADKVNDRIKVALAKIAGGRRMTMALPIVGTLPYASPRADLTTDIVVALDGTTRELAEARNAEREAADRVRQLEAARPPPATATAALAGKAGR